MRLTIYYIAAAIFIAISALQSTSASGKEISGEVTFSEFEQIPVSIESPFVHYLAQDSSGLVWVCTNKGLFHYDGYTMVPCFDKSGPYHKQMQCLLFSGDRILVGTDLGLVVYDMEHKTYTDNSAFSDIKGIVNSITSDSEGNIWIGHSDGLHILKPGSMKAEAVDIGPERQDQHMSVFTVLDGKDGFYIGAYGGLYRRGADGNFTRLSPEGRSSENAAYTFNVNAICDDSQRHCLWLGTYHGLWKYDLISGRFLHIPETGKLRINSLVLDSSGRLLVGSNSGLWIHDGETFIQLTHDTRSDKSLANNNVESILIDRDGNVWIGTHNGISLSRHSQAGEYIPLSAFSQDGDGITISTMLCDSKGGLWCGGLEGAIHLDADGKSELYLAGNNTQKPSYTNINDLYEDEDGNIWAASASGILLYERQNRSFRMIRIHSREYSMEGCQAISGDGHGKLCVGTFSAGIFIFDKEGLISGTRLQPLKRLYENFPKGQVKQIVSGEDGSWWILFYNRRMAHISNSGEPIHFNLEDYGYKVFLTRIALDSDGNLWAGYKGGLICISPDTGESVEIVFPETDRSNVTSISVAPDAVWAITSDGYVRKIDRKTHEQTLLPLPVKRYTSSCYIPDIDAIMLGGTDGITMVDLPLKISQSPFRTPVITSIQVNGEEYTGSMTGLKHDENNLTLSFSSLNYSPPGNDQYAYRLEPFSEEWIQLPSGTNLLSFVNLNPGHYRLLLCMTDGAGIPVEDTAQTLEISIAPPFFQSPLAYILYIFILAAFIVWVVSTIRVRTKLRQEQFEKNILQSQASAKIDFLTNISHDLKTPLSLIIGPATILQGKMPDEDSIRNLDTIKSNAEKLNRLISKILDFRNQDLGTGTSESVKSTVDLVSLIESIAERYRLEASRREIDFSCTFSSGSIFYRCDLHKMESIIDNLLSNAFKYTPDDGKINISLLLIEATGKICITVADTGIGIPPEEMPHIFHRFFQSSRTRDSYPGSGIGLFLVKKYVTEMEGTIEAESSGQSGTTFIIELPVKEPVSEPADNTPEKENRKKPDVLVVEDNQELAGFISALLKDMATVYTAGNGRDGLALFRKIHPSLVITDLMMPVMAGQQMSSRIREDEYGSTVPIIMLTVKADNATELQSIKANIDYFIAKPFDANKLKLQAEHCLKIRERQRKEAIMDAVTQTRAAETVSSNEKFIIQITGIIEKNIDSPDLNVSFLAEQARLSPKQLTRQLKAVLGCTPVEYIRNIRIKQAAAMLERGGYFTIAEVMYAVGFTDPSYFARCFQDKFGCTPTQFKKKNS